MIETRNGSDQTMKTGKRPLFPKIALDFRIAQNAERQSVQVRKMANGQHKLNLLAAVTFPLMAGAALFGMNMVHGLENEAPVLFWLVLAVGVVVGMFTQKWVTTGRG